MSTRSADYRGAVDHLPAGGMLVVHDVSWEAYEQLLDDLADRPGVRVTYDAGKMQIVSPLPEHEEFKRFIERLIDVAGEELDLNLEPRGSTTWKRSQDTRGAEPDSCYYVAHSAQIAGKRTIDLQVDPPPDLVIEIDVTNESLDKFPIYSTFAVPEVWRYEVKRHRVHFYELRGSAYVDIASSRSFPILTPEVLADFIDHSKTRGQQAALAAFRDWVRAQSRVR